MLSAELNSSEKYFQSVKINPVILKVSFTVLLFFWILGFLHPVIISRQNFFIMFLIDRIYSVVCHQENQKCLSFSGESLLVCSRCAGIYFGAILTSLFTINNFIPQLKLKVLIFATLPLIADVFLTSFGFYYYSKWIAFITGLFFGGVICLFLLYELENYLINKSVKRNE